MRCPRSRATSQRGTARSCAAPDDEWHFVVFLDEEGRVVSTWGVEAGLGEAATDD
jgi:hypothetical protein